MEEENENLEELEQQLYAQVYHDSNLVDMSINVVNLPDNTTELKTSSNSKNIPRYWQNEKPSNENTANKNSAFKQRQKLGFNKNPPSFYRKPIVNNNNNNSGNNGDPEKPAALKPYFAPYSSVLSFMNTSLPIEQHSNENIKDNSKNMAEPAHPPSYEKKKSKVTKYPKEKGKFLKPSKELSKQKYEEKKVKAEAVRNKVNKNKNIGSNNVMKKSGDIIDLATSSDDDSIIHVENPPPPLISLDSSDDETRKRKKKAGSPSTSSMISDDFIVASDKRRLINPFANPNSDHHLTAVSSQLKDVLKENERMKKLKDLTKVSSSSSNSNSARSSCERNDDKKEPSSSKSAIGGSSSGNNKNNSKRERVCDSDNEDDSIYSSKVMTSKKDVSGKNSQSSSSSDAEDNSICVTAKGVKSKRRRSTGSRKGKDSEENEDNSKAKPTTSTPIVQQKKRSRFITPNYNENEFATLISTVIQANSDEETNDTINNSKSLIDDIEKDERLQTSTVENADQLMDCQVIKPNIPTYEILSDEEQKEANEDSDDDSIKNVSNDIEYDLTLNIKRTEHTPHEFAPIEETPNTSHHELSNVLDCEVGWNDEMRYFYNECTMGRDFCITTIKNAMPSDPKLWRINHADKTRMYTDNDRKIRCRNCNEWGHKERYCPRPRKKIICYMCGEIGHRETRCPNSICLRCGKPNEFYATMCSNCSKFSKKTCPLCHMKGHDIDQCPDKWRRYHSTTTVAECQTLDISYTQNKRIFCSLCARAGHFADNCSYINKVFQGLIKSSWFAISNKPSYPTNYSFNQSRENEHVLQLITYMEHYSFNLKIPSNCQFYPKFKEAFLRHRDQLRMRELPPSQSKQKKKKKKREESSTINESSASKQENNITTMSTHHANDDSNSNYSFSEFYNSNDRPSNSSSNNITNDNENQIISDRNNPQQLSDFVPLMSTNVEDCQQICDSKVFLTKEHASILMSQKGQNLLVDLGERFNIVSQFQFDSMGNSICLTGFPTNQQFFHTEMKDFLYKCGLDDYEKMIEKTTQIPKIINRTVSFIKSNFQSVKNSSIRDTKKLLDSFMSAEKSLDHKKAIKLRRALNTIFIGHGELGDGARHVSELKRILGGLEREVYLGNGNGQVDPKLRNEISIHIRYVFSAVDHSSLYGDYRKMFEEYRKIMMKRANNRNSFSNKNSGNNYNNNNSSNIR